MPKLYYDTIEVGDPVAPLTKPPITRVQIAKFAGASLDYSPLHIDDDFAKAAGYGGVFAHGAISLGFAIEAVSRWMENGRVLSATATFQKLVWPGDILTAKGVIVRRDLVNDEPRIEVDVWAENQNHDIVMKGSISCILWRNEKDEKRIKGAWPPLSAATLAAAKRGEAPLLDSAARGESEPQRAAGKEKPAAKKAEVEAPQTAKPAPAAKKAPAPAAKPAPAKAAPAPAAKDAAAPKKAAPPPAKKPAPAAPAKVAKAPSKPAAPAAKDKDKENKAPAKKTGKPKPEAKPDKKAAKPEKPAKKKGK